MGHDPSHGTSHQTAHGADCPDQMHSQHEPSPLSLPADLPHTVLSHAAAFSVEHLDQATTTAEVDRPAEAITAMTERDHHGTTPTDTVAVGH